MDESAAAAGYSFNLKLLLGCSCGGEGSMELALWCDCCTAGQRLETSPGAS